MWTVRRWLEFWLSEAEGRLRPLTLRSYRTIVYQHLIPQLGTERLSKLRTRTVQRAMDRIGRQRVRSGRSIAAGTVNRIRVVLRSAERGTAARDDRSEPGVAATPTQRRPPARSGVGRAA
jgi:hypothetical protein